MVHEGAFLRNGTALGGRPWMYGAIAGELGVSNEFVAAEVFAEEYEASGSFSKAFRSTARIGNDHVKVAFDLGWTWPRETKRRNGEIAGTVRNIIDTGKLKRSQRGVKFL
ncbi:MAG: hypothetical protein AAF959_22635 [Cyanobacteria bacterium P01_D01_bin.56]